MRDSQHVAVNEFWQVYWLTKVQTWVGSCSLGCLQAEGLGSGLVSYVWMDERSSTLIIQSVCTRSEKV